MMKKCAICGHDCKPSAYSCTKCGESTWVQPPPVSDESPTVRMAAVKPLPPENPARRAVHEIRSRRTARDPD